MWPMDDERKMIALHRLVAHTLDKLTLFINFIALQKAPLSYIYMRPWPCNVIHYYIEDGPFLVQGQGLWLMTDARKANKGSNTPLLCSIVMPVWYVTCSITHLRNVAPMFKHNLKTVLPMSCIISMYSSSFSIYSTAGYTYMRHHCLLPDRVCPDTMRSLLKR